MKKIFIIILAFIFSFILSEIFVSEILNYPKFKLKYSNLGLKKTGKRNTNFFQPYSEFTNYETGYKVFKRNNLGIQGTDVIISDSSKYIFLIGDSFIKSSAIEPNLIASSVLQDKIGKQSKYQVLNLSEDGYNAYDLFFLTEYYSKKYKPEIIVYVFEQDLTSINDVEVNKMDFNTENNLGNNNDNQFFKFKMFIRNNSSILNLFYGKLLESKNSVSIQVKNLFPFEEQNRVIRDKEEIISQQMIISLTNFYKKYGDNFFLISILNNDEYNNQLQEICKSNNIPFAHNPLMQQKYRINGVGHLNPEGNIELGYTIYKTISEKLK